RDMIAIACVMLMPRQCVVSFFFTATASTEIYTLSLHDALPIFNKLDELKLANDTIVVFFSDNGPNSFRWNGDMKGRMGSTDEGRSEEHTSELQSRENLVCRLLLEKKKQKTN